MDVEEIIEETTPLYDKIIRDAEVAMKEYPGQRWGQCLVNSLSKNSPFFYSLLSQTEMDVFYTEDVARVEKFKKHLLRCTIYLTEE